MGKPVVEMREFVDKWELIEKEMRARARDASLEPRYVFSFFSILFDYTNTFLQLSGLRIRPPPPARTHPPRRRPGPLDCFFFFCIYIVLITQVRDSKQDQALSTPPHFKNLKNNREIFGRVIHAHNGNLIGHFICSFYCTWFIIAQRPVTWDIN
jgi:hypothetical protein